MLLWPVDLEFEVGRALFTHPPETSLFLAFRCLQITRYAGGILTPAHLYGAVFPSIARIEGAPERLIEFLCFTVEYTDIYPTQPFEKGSLLGLMEWLPFAIQVVVYEKSKGAARPHEITGWCMSVLSEYYVHRLSRLRYTVDSHSLALPEHEVQLAGLRAEVHEMVLMMDRDLPEFADYSSQMIDRLFAIVEAPAPFTTVHNMQIPRFDPDWIRSEEADTAH